MKLWKALLMLIVVSGLAYYAMRDLYKEPEMLKPRVLPNVSAGAIRGIRAEFAGGSYEIVKVETTLSPEEQIALGTDQPHDRWVLFFPPGAPLDPELSNQMTQALSELREEYSFADGESTDSLVDMGLVPPELQVSITFGKEKKIILFGKEHAVTKRRYLQIENEPKIYLVSAEFYNLFRKKALGLRLTSPLRVEASKIRKIEINDRDGASHFFLRTGEGAWSLGYGKELIVLKDPTVVEKLVGQLVSPSVTNYFDGELPEQAVERLRNPRFRVEVKVDLTEGKQRSYRFALGDFPENLFNLAKEQAATMYLFRWQSSPWAYSVAKLNFALIGKRYGEFLSKDLFNQAECDRLKVDSVSVSGVKQGKLQNVSKLEGELCGFQALSFATESIAATGDLQSGSDDRRAFEIRGKGSKGDFLLTVSRPIKLYGATDSSDDDAPYSGSISWGNAVAQHFEISSVFVKKLEELIVLPSKLNSSVSGAQGNEGAKPAILKDGKNVH